MKYRSKSPSILCIILIEWNDQQTFDTLLQGKGREMVVIVLQCLRRKNFITFVRFLVLANLVSKLVEL